MGLLIKGRIPADLEILKINLIEAKQNKKDAENYLKIDAKNPFANKVRYNKDKLNHAKKAITRLIKEIYNLKPKTLETKNIIKKELYKYKGDSVTNETFRTLSNGIKIKKMTFSDGKTLSIKI